MVIFLFILDIVLVVYDSKFECSCQSEIVT